MADDTLNEAEERYLRQLQARPASVRSRLVAWALELTPSIGLFAYGLASDQRLFLILGFLSLLYFSLWRMYGQLRGARMLKRIVESSTGSVDAPKPNGRPPASSGPAEAGND